MGSRPRGANNLGDAGMTIAMFQDGKGYTNEHGCNENPEGSLYCDQ